MSTKRGRLYNTQKRIVLLFSALTLLLLASCSGGTADNPLLSDFDTPFGVPPFDRIANEDFVPAVQKGMAEEDVEIEQIVSNPEQPTFANTIEALEYSGKSLNRVLNVFYNYSSANTGSEIQAIEEQLTPLLSTHYDNISLNDKLFQRVKTVYDNRDTLGLSPEQMRLLEKKYRGFVRSGALLSEDQKSRLREINQELSLLSTQFGQHLLADVNDYQLVVTNEAELTGLSQSAIDVAAATAEAEGLNNSWVFTLQEGSVMPFLSYDDTRDLRYTMQRAYINRGNNDNANDNKQIVAEIANLRLELAQLFGYDNYAEYALEDTMAGSVEAVTTFLPQVWEPALNLAKTEAAELQALMDAEGRGETLEQWDWRYYAEKVRQEKYDYDEEELRPYLELNAVRDGVFSVAQRLYGLQFVENTDIPRIHPDVQAFEVREANGNHIGILYMDFYSRASKQSGAWMSSLREQGVDSNGAFIYPIVYVTYNFTKATEGSPTLLTLTDTVTVFHEVGHALNGLLSKVTYPSLSGTNTSRDFVELPSQIMEEWAKEPTVLSTFARHYETGEPMPQELIDKIQASAYFNQGFSNVEILASTYLDMEYHTITEPFDASELSQATGIVEQRTIDNTGLIPEIYFRHGSTHFSHIFNGGYSAGYYGYTWSAMLEADAFDAFRQTGDFFDPATALSFRRNILEKGGTEDLMQMYVDFRGREPIIEPLLRERGLE